MADGEVRYCTTEDGVRIAYCIEGEGPTLIMCPFFVESFSLDERLPELVQFMDKLRPGRRIVRYDGRGTGLSERRVTTFAASVDIAAVADAIEIPQFSVWASGVTGPSAIRFAAQYPERVERLVLCGTYARRGAAFSSGVLRGFTHLASTNWPLAAQLFGVMSTRQSDAAAGVRWGEVIRESISGEAIAQLMAGAVEGDEDVTHQLSAILAPTLVLHRRDDPNFPFALGQELAAAIPNATFVPLDGDISHYSLGDQDSVLRALLPFLPVAETTGDAAVTRASRDAASAVRAVLVTDLVGHTEMMQRLGDARGRDVLREHERITRQTLRQHGGAEIKTMGDGFMASFGSVTRAMECAIALQRAFASWNEDRAGPERHADLAKATSLQAAPHAPLHVRVGLNAGEPIEEDGDLFGATVILASRVCAQAGPGEILVPEPVRHLLAGKSYAYADRGAFVPKGFDDAVRLFEVRWQP